MNKLLLKEAILTLASVTKSNLETAILATVPIFTLATLGYETQPEASLLNKRARLAAALYVTKLTINRMGFNIMTAGTMTCQNNTKQNDHKQNDL